MDGLEALAEIKRLRPETAVVMISGHGTIETAVKATKLGAYDFIEKPLSLEKTLLAASRALDHGRLERQNRDLREQLERGQRIVGQSRAIEEMRQQIAIAAPTNGRVLIHGENGAGKELVARAIHAQSTRRDGPFVEVNCAAIPEELIETELFGHERGAFTGAVARRRGRFELADGGTIFLDEIGDMSLQDPGEGAARAARSRRSSAWAARRRSASTSACSPPRTRISRSRSPWAASARTSSTASPSFRSRCRRCAQRQEDMPLLVEHFIRALLGGERQAAQDHVGGGPRLFPLLRLAGQCPRAAQHGRAARHHDAGRRDRPRGPAPAAPPARCRALRRRREPEGEDAQGGARGLRARVHPEPSSASSTGT